MNNKIKCFVCDRQVIVDFREVCNATVPICRNNCADIFDIAIKRIRQEEVDEYALLADKKIKKLMKKLKVWKQEN